MLKSIFTRLAGAVLVLTSLAIAVTLVRSEPQPIDPPTPQPAASVPAKPAPVVEYKPAPIVKPVAKGHFEKRYIEGAWRFVWFADGVKKVTVSKPASKPVYSSGNCANGQCGRSGRRGWR